jgi:hypothetical protein
MISLHERLEPWICWYFKRHDLPNEFHEDVLIGPDIISGGHTDRQIAR